MGVIAYKGNIYGGATTLEELTNVNVNEPSDGQILKYDEENEKWVNDNLSKSDVGLGNVDNTSDANKPISTAAQAALNNKANVSDIASVKTVTGNPITLTDGSETYADELSVDLEPIQSGSGTPSPSNIRPIQGYDIVSVGRAKSYQRCVANNFISTTVNGLTMSYLGNGKYHVKGTMTSQTNTSLVADINEIVCYDGTDSYLAFHNTYGNVNVLINFNNGNTQVSSWSLTPVDRYSAYTVLRGQTINKFVVYFPSSFAGTTFDFTLQPEFISNDTLNKMNVQLGQTVYGATVDVANGVMIVDRGYVDLGDLTWEASSTAHCFYASTNKTTLPYDTTDAELVCSRYQYDGMHRVAPFYGESGTIRVYLPTSSQTVRELYVCDDNFTTISDFITAMSGVQLVYKLDTPIIIPLESQQLKLLKGYNYILSNGTTIHLTYQLDNAVGDAVSEAEKYADRIKLNPVTILDDVAVSSSSVQYTIPDISQYTMVQFVLTTCPAPRVAYVRDTKTIPVSVLLHNIATYTYNHLITLLGMEPSNTDKWTECRIEMNSTTQISVRSTSGTGDDGSPRLSIIAW